MDPKLLALQAQITAAAERDDAAGLAAPCLAHARADMAQSPANPIEAARTGRLAEGLAWIEKCDPEIRSTWQLTLVRELLDHRADAAEAAAHSIIDNMAAEAATQPRRERVAAQHFVSKLWAYLSSSGPDFLLKGQIGFARHSVVADLHQGGRDQSEAARL